MRRGLGRALLAVTVLLSMPSFQGNAEAASQVELRLANGETVAISRLVVSNGSGSLALEVAEGRLRQLLGSPKLTGIPSLGSLAASPFPVDELKSETRIGAAWRDGGLLFLVVDQPRIRLETIQSATLFNDRWSYRLLGQAKAIDLDIAKDIPRFGGVPTVQRWLRLLPERDDIRLLTIGMRRNPIGLLSPKAKARQDIEALSTFYVGDVHRSQNQLGIVIYPSDAAK